MTHDELLAKIDIWKFQTKGYDDTYEVHGILNALRAVVELHKPYESTDNGLLCRYEVNSNSPYHWYPCETIQAIEKELG
jgi:hypothetical protein